MVESLIVEIIVLLLRGKRTSQIWELLALTDFVVVAITSAPEGRNVYSNMVGVEFLAPAGRHPLLADVAPNGARTNFSSSL